MMKVNNRYFFLLFFLLFTLISKALKQSSFRKKKKIIHISELKMVKFLSWNLLLNIAVRQS